MSTSRSRKVDILSSSFTLPALEDSFYLFKDNLFTRELLPLNSTNSNKNRIKIDCTNCTYSTLSSQPINTTNLKSHYKHKHRNLIHTISNIDNIEESSSSLDINSSFSTTSSSSNSNLFNSTIRKRPSFILFNKEEYRSFLLKFIINNNLPFRIVESNSFNNLLKFLKDDISTISKRSIKEDLDKLYNKEFNKIKKKLASNISFFSLTLDKQSSSNSIDFLGITISFYNNSFNLESFLIAFKNLENYKSYIGIILYNLLDKVLKDLNINKRILSITRDNASSITSLVQELKENYNTKYKIEIIDNRCVVHILNLITNSFLTYLCFIPSNTIAYNTKVKNLIKDNRDYSLLYKEYTDLPNLVRSIVNTIKYNIYFKNNFKKLVRQYKKIDYSTLVGLERLVKDNTTRQLSIYNILDRFIYFKEEINTLLTKAKKELNNRRKNFKIDRFNIIEVEQNYLIYIRNTLEIFRKPTIKF